VYLSLSKKKHLPVLHSKNIVGQCNFSLWNYRTLRRIEKTGLMLDPMGVNALLEIMKIGDKYIPPFGLQGKTVLDIGAGCGETAWLFFKHGAKKVICVESNKQRSELIRRNADRLGWNVEILNTKFAPEHLLLPHDFVKCDIEGYEMELLPHIKSPCVLESHNWWINEQFRKKGFYLISEPDPMLGTCLMANY